MSTLQERLENNYARNLKVFEALLPHIYKKLTSQSDENYALELFDNEINISKNNQLIYPKGQVQKYFKELLNSYFKKDLENILKYEVETYSYDTSMEDYGMETIHRKYHYAFLLNNYELFKKVPLINKPKHNFIYTMMVYGVGLGYHIPELLKRYNIKHLVLTDVSIEMIRASLFTLDWYEIMQIIAKKDQDRTITFMIHDENETISDQVALYLRKYRPMGYYNLWQFYSYNDEVLNKNIEHIKYNIDFYTGKYLGFYDDEAWSMQYTLHNIKEKIPFLVKSDFKVDGSKHIFLIANGPSLDSYINIIKKYQDDVITIAVGSSLGSLYKYGIKPDFFIDVERGMITYNAVKNFAPKEYLESVIFLGNNTIHPKGHILFKNSYLFCKSHDTGANIIQHHIKDKFVTLDNTNPTVANGALAIAIHLGFKNISLFGMDFGFRSLDNHHSKNSIYCEKDSVFYKEKSTNYLEVKGVNGDTVYTETVYNDSRKAIERALENLNDNLKVYNFSEGAYINHTINSDKDSPYLDNIPKDPVNKIELINSITKQFEPNDTPININYTAISRSFNDLIEFIKQNNNKSLNSFTYLKLTDNIILHYQKLFQELPFLFSMVNGTLYSLLGKIYVYTSALKHSQKVSLYIYSSLELLCSCLEDIKNNIINLESTVTIASPKKHIKNQNTEN